VPGNRQLDQPAQRPAGAAHSEQEFSIDGQEGIKKPLGMSGMKLDVEVHIGHRRGGGGAEHHEVRASCGLEVSEMILQPLASSKAVLNDDEKDLGVCLVDIGGGTTDVAIFYWRRHSPHRRDSHRG